MERQPAAPAADTPFDLALARLDVGLFDAIESYTSENDRRSLLACQAGMRSVADGYVYLEIGAYIGGSLQPHVLDPRCLRAYAIDRRPTRQLDERGVSFAYQGNTTARMMRGLARLSPDGAGKVVCIDADARDVATEGIDPRPHLCFIDGEHTNEAVVRDFAFCRQVVAPGGAIGVSRRADRLPRPR